MRVVCPRCRLSLRTTGDQMVCEGGHAYPVVHGIPDLRLHGDPYLTVAEDYAAADRLSRHASRGYREMLAAYYEENDKVSAAQASRFVAGVEAAGDRAAVVLKTWQVMSGRSLSHDSEVVDLGAGTGPLAIAVARAGARVLAVDAGMRWLVVAAQRCREAGVSVDLVCANAEAMPLADGSVDVVAGESVWENLTDQVRGASEVHRVLRPKGHALFSMPNKYFPGPDPHVGLLAGGYFSDQFVARYATRRGMLPPRRRLLSEGSGRALLRAAGFDDLQVTAPPIADAQQRGAPPVIRAAITLYHLALRTPGLRALLRLIGPTLLVTARA